MDKLYIDAPGLRMRYFWLYSVHVNSVASLSILLVDKAERFTYCVVKQQMAMMHYPSNFVNYVTVDARRDGSSI